MQLEHKDCEDEISGDGSWGTAFLWFTKGSIFHTVILAFYGITESSHSGRAETEIEANAVVGAVVDAMWVIPGMIQL